MKTEAELRTYLFMLGFKNASIEGKHKSAQYHWRMEGCGMWAGKVNWHHIKDRNSAEFRWKVHNSGTYHIFHTLPCFADSIEKHLKIKDEP